MFRATLSLAPRLLNPEVPTPDVQVSILREVGPLTVRFFGDFLIEEGVIEAFQLRQGSDHMAWLNRTLGDLAVRQGYMSASDIARVRLAQEGTDMRFGETALGLGVLTREQLDDLLADQSARQARMGEALVELGYLEESRLKQLLERFEAEQGQYLPENRSIPDALRDPELVRALLAWLPKVALRAALLVVKVGAAAPWSAERSYEHQELISVGDSTRLEVGLAADAGFAVSLAAGQLGGDPESLTPEAISNAFSDFLHRVVQAAIDECSPDSGELRIDAAHPGRVPDAGFGFEFVSPKGRGLLLLSAG